MRTCSTSAEERLSKWTVTPADCLSDGGQVGLRWNRGATRASTYFACIENATRGRTAAIWERVIADAGRRLTERQGGMSGRGYIAAEEDGRCEMCGKIEETRPYGPNGERVCFDCGMKDEKSAKRQMNKYLFGEHEA